MACEDEREVWVECLGILEFLECLFGHDCVQTNLSACEDFKPAGAFMPLAGTFMPLAVVNHHGTGFGDDVPTTAIINDIGFVPGKAETGLLEFGVTAFWLFRWSFTYDCNPVRSCHAWRVSADAVDHIRFEFIRFLKAVIDSCMVRPR
jgi:hypothetical protein